MVFLSFILSAQADNPRRPPALKMAEMVEMVAEMILQARLVVVALAEILVLEFLAGKFLQYLEIIIVQVEMVAMLQMVLLRAKTANLVHFVLAI